MILLPRAVGESRRRAPEVFSTLSRHVLELETALHEVRGTFWNESSRERAREVALAISFGCTLWRIKGSGAVLRSLLALLALPYREARALRTSLVERLSELISVLKEQLPERGVGPGALVPGGTPGRRIRGTQGCGPP
jgi:hypothetical protein